MGRYEYDKAIFEIQKWNSANRVITKRGAFESAKEKAINSLIDLANKIGEITFETFTGIDK